MRHSMVESEIQDVIILGAGFSGLGLGVLLRKAGFEKFKIIEKATKVGGTWFHNQYPGCGCDVKSHLYSFSFFPKPDWSREYARAGEIQKYSEAVVEHFGLATKLQLDTEVTEAIFEKDQNLWQVQTKDGKTHYSRFFINACGPLHVPNIPKFSGLEDFKGTVLHSAKWDPSFTAKGKKIISVGTGASAIQYIPELAKDAKKLFVLQRTPAWVLPKIDTFYSKEIKEKFRKSPLTQKIHRLRIYLENEAFMLPFKYPRFAPRFEKIIKNRIKRHVKSQELQKKLTPNYRLGCKRVLLSNDYYKTFNQENVELHTQGIKKFFKDGVELRDGTKIEADALVFGTGFVTDPRLYLKKLPIRGENGISLDQQWLKNGPEAYKGITVDGFPNYFMMVGPNTGLGHNSIIFMIECQAKYIVQCLKKMRKTQKQKIETRQSSMGKYNIWLQNKLKTTAWNAGCNSWYLGKDGKNFTIWPETTISYAIKTRKPVFKHFKLS